MWLYQAIKVNVYINNKPLNQSHEENTNSLLEQT